MTQTPEKTELIALTTEIVSAYVANNTIVASELPALIGGVCHALTKASASETQPAKEDVKPAISIKKSVRPDHLVCLEDGKKFKSIKRHLRVHHDLTPEEYRERWGLAHDYPMVSPNYAEARSALAKKLGLGQKRKN